MQWNAIRLEGKKIMQDVTTWMNLEDRGDIQEEETTLYYITP